MYVQNQGVYVQNQDMYVQNQGVYVQNQGVYVQNQALYVQNQASRWSISIEKSIWSNHTDMFLQVYPLFLSVG